MHMKSHSWDCLPHRAGCASPAQDCQRVESPSTGTNKTKDRARQGIMGAEPGSCRGWFLPQVVPCGEARVLCLEFGPEVQVLSWSWVRLVLQGSGVSVAPEEQGAPLGWYRGGGCWSQPGLLSPQLAQEARRIYDEFLSSHSVSPVNIDKQAWIGEDMLATPSPDMFRIQQLQVWQHLSSTHRMRGLWNHPTCHPASLLSPGAVPWGSARSL